MAYEARGPRLPLPACLPLRARASIAVPRSLSLDLYSRESARYVYEADVDLKRLPGFLPQSRDYIQVILS